MRTLDEQDSRWMNSLEESTKTPIALFADEADQIATGIQTYNPTRYAKSFNKAYDRFDEKIEEILSLDLSVASFNEVGNISRSLDEIKISKRDLTTSAASITHVSLFHPHFS